MATVVQTNQNTTKCGYFNDYTAFSIIQSRDRISSTSAIHFATTSNKYTIGTGLVGSAIGTGVVGSTVGTTTSIMGVGGGMHDYAADVTYSTKPGNTQLVYGGLAI